ncbi:LADA_0G15852g1_1 [Lachancea dasiensis]|uniref:Increased recombination centers protein 6 n=1 Tax=Lachancea dasiensis TaxID=1072105 RepID=A0A1G4JWK1_9SACH|nr:LADA_0G15852g1_1 [Lachancea dasiensis]
MEQEETKHNHAVEILPSKVLIVFSNEVLNREDILMNIFNVSVDPSRQIHRDVHWSNKYFTVNFDIYIDEFDYLDEWVNEFCCAEFDDLRQALAGCILIMPCKDRNTGNDGNLYKLALLGKCKGWDEKFAIILATDLNVDEDVRCRLEQGLLETGVELTSVTGSDTEKEYGETFGIQRIKEVIDTFEWPPEMIKRRDQTAGKLTKFLEEPAFPLEDIMSQLQQARAKYLKMNPGEERDNFAHEMADELGRNLYGSSPVSDLFF